ncbi:hypothetical protein evm_002201 [Chilo suppressalis]|nr:hypothetical protein evm_002201 [Chilo suppressalis]
MERKHTPFTTVTPQQSSSISVGKDSGRTPNNSSVQFPANLPGHPPGKPSRLKTAKDTRKAKGDCLSSSSSGTQYYKKERHKDTYVRITKDEYFGKSESISGSSSTLHCVHGPEGKLYSEKGLLKRNLTKVLDPIPLDPAWNDKCPPAYGWDIAQKLEFLVTDIIGMSQHDRIEGLLRDFAIMSRNGYKIHVLDSVCVILNYLVENLNKKPKWKEYLSTLLLNMEKPILLNASSDVVTHFRKISSYIGFMGYLLMRMEDGDLFILVSKAMMWQLSAPDQCRGPGVARLRVVLAAAGPVLIHTAVRMLAVTDAHRFPTFLEIALLLASDSADNCIKMMKENIIEHVFYRFNPYFPEGKLPPFDENPANLQDWNVKLGESSLHMTTTLSLLLVLLKTTKDNLELNPTLRTVLPCPDAYSQRCFMWAYRYECRAREHQHERTTLTVIIGVLLHCFRDRLAVFSSLMPELMSLSVLTELPKRNDWIGTVNMNTGQLDVHFKSILIEICVDFIKHFPANKFMVESRYWLLGLMYLVDPGLCHLRARWSPALFAELRKTALKALVCVLPLMPPRLAVEYGLTRRIMWYIEWYSENPYELPILYWCLRLLQVIVENRGDCKKRFSLIDLFDTHGIIIIIHLSYTLLKKKIPPVEKAQAVIALNLQLLTDALDVNRQLSCCVYPDIKWPSSINALTRKMIDTVLLSLEKHYIISDRMLVSLMNFIWEAVIWNPEHRTIFIANSGIYHLLDIITMTRAPVQCIALAILCDVARAGNAVGQLVTWRASVSASQAHPNIVKRGATITSLLAAIFRDECHRTGVCINEYGIIENLDCPIMSAEVRKTIYDKSFLLNRDQRTPVCPSAGDLAGSRLSKVFAILHLLSDDLDYAVTLADEAYNMYKNIKLAPEDLAVLVLCSHYMTLKLNEVWVETKIQSPCLLPQDQDVLEEFLNIGVGWAKEIKRQQEEVIEKDIYKENEEEMSLYAFLARVRLNIALQALREVRCAARSADRARITTGMIHDAVLAHHRRYLHAKKIDSPVLQTYGATLDDQNITGQNVKVYSIFPKNKPKQKDYVLPS